MDAILYALVILVILVLVGITAFFSNIAAYVVCRVAVFLGPSPAVPAAGLILGLRIGGVTGGLVIVGSVLLAMFALGVWLDSKLYDRLSVSIDRRFGW